MKTLRDESAYEGFPDSDAKCRQFAPYSSNGGDLGSVDSTDTFASCNTHPFHSQGDLTSDVAEPSCAIDSNLYVNPLDKSGENSPVTPARTSGFKKSASGDTALRSLGTSPVDEIFKGFGPLDRGSRVSLNDSPLPRQRRTRFQQVRGGLMRGEGLDGSTLFLVMQNFRPKTRFGDAFERDSQESLEKKHSKKAAFNPTRSLASATRIINQHLFGLQNFSGIKAGKNQHR